MSDAERAVSDAEQRVRRTLMLDENCRPLTERERFLVGQVSMFGSDGYPVRKLDRGWTAENFPTVFKTRRDATAAFERYMEVVHDLLWIEQAKKGGR